VQPDQSAVHLRVVVTEGAQAQVDSLTLLGQPGLSESNIRSRLGVEPDAPYSAVQLAERITALQAQYLDEDFLLSTIEPPGIRYDQRSNRVAVTIALRAGPRVTVRFKGNPYWSSGALRELVLIQTEQSVENDVLDASAARMQHHLVDDGYLTAEVAAERDGAAADARVTATFRITAGPRFEVGRLTVTGPVVMERSQLLDRLRMRPGFLGLTHPRFDQAEWEDDLERLRRFYMQHGFLSATITGNRQLRPAKSAVDLSITVEEGPRTLITAITFTGQTRLPDALLQRTISVRVGRPYDPTQARADRLALLALYAGKGYLGADVTMEPALNEPGTEVVLPFTITEGAPTFIGRILIEGNEHTDDEVIRRELLIFPADPYDYEKLLRSRYRIARLGIFRDVRLEPIEAKRPDLLKDLRLSVEERPAGALEFGVGFAAEEKVRGFAELSHKNLAGTGRRASLRAEADFIQQRYALNYVEPWIAGLPVDLRLTALFEAEEEVTFKRRTYGATAAIDKNLTDRLKASLLYRYSFNRFRLDPNTTLAPEDERVNIGSITPALILDLRDDPFNPHWGSVHGISFEDAALMLGSQVQFVKITASSNWFVSPHRLIVFAFSGRAGWAKQFGDTPLVPLSERFYLGGRSTVRGYRQDTLGVLRLAVDTDGNSIPSEDSTLSATGDPTGGNIMLLTNVEARIALPKNLGLVLFLDGGNVWSKPGTIQLNEMKFSVGAGIRYNTPVGPLRLDWGYKLNRERIFIDNSMNATPAPNINIDESAYEIHFTLGHAF
jgi:outer membrane protein insertion porin family